MRDSLPSARSSPVCNVLRQWKTSLIPIYRVYRLYDNCSMSRGVRSCPYVPRVPRRPSFCWRFESSKSRIIYIVVAIPLLAFFCFNVPKFSSQYIAETVLPPIETSRKLIYLVIITIIFVRIIQHAYNFCCESHYNATSLLWIFMTAVYSFHSASASRFPGI